MGEEDITVHREEEAKEAENSEQLTDEEKERLIPNLKGCQK